MNILIAPDKFKGSLSASAVCASIADGLLRKDPSLVISALPLADGGEGTCEILTEHFNGTRIPLSVPGPLMEPVSTGYGISADNKMAFIEMASASGLQLLSPAQRDPARTTSLGTGVLIRHAIDRGVSKLILGLGGSATNDAGIGIAKALGFSFLDGFGAELDPTGASLNRINNIQHANAHHRIRHVRFIALCDVSNPLHGPEGAAHVYAPQKGADPAMVEQLDHGLKNFERVVKKDLKMAANFPGAGAAGGAGAGARIFLGATMEKGFNFLAEVVNLEEHIRRSDLVITGEGKLDDQSLYGKVVHEVGRCAGKFNKPVILVCGRNELSPEKLRRMKSRQAIFLNEVEPSVEKAMMDASRLLADCVFHKLELTPT